IVAITTQQYISVIFFLHELLKMPPKNDYPLKFSGEELNGKEKKLYRISGKYFETYQTTAWSIDSFLDYLDNNKGNSHKFPLIVKKEIFTSWLEKKLECGNISSQKKSDAIPSRSLIKTGKPCDNYINFDDYTEQTITKETEGTLRIEINKDISLYDEPGYIYIYK
ncbi:36395_t:CDS:2, partial [Racocetra persica]